LDLIRKGAFALIAYITPDFRYAWTSSAMEDLYSVTAEEVKQRPVEEVVGPAIWEIIKPYLDRAMGGERTEADLFLPTRSGNMRSVRVRYLPDFDESGIVAGLMAFVLDLTSERNEIEALKLSREYFPRLFQNVPVPTFLVDHGGYILAANGSALRLCQLDIDQIAGKRPPLISADNQAYFDDCLNAARSGSTVENISLKGIDRLGKSLDLRLSAKPFESNSTDPGQILLVIMDETKQLELERKFLHSQRMETIGKLAGGIAHDSNNFLGLLLGHLDLIRSRMTDNPEIIEIIDSAVEATLSASELNKQLLAFARRQTLTPTRVDINATIDGMTRLFARTLGEMIDVRFNGEQIPLPVYIDRAQFEASLLNLCVNARDAMESGGVLTIDTRAVEVSPIDAQSYDIAPGNYVVIAVSDNGSGILPENLSKVTEPFFTTKPIGQGSGLGLSTVVGFVKQSGGHLTIYSEIGVGTTVRLYLPASSAEGLSTKPDDLIPTLPNIERQALILVVEDQSKVRAMVARQITELGYIVESVSSPREALALLDEGLQPDILLTDVIMPGGMDGLQLAKVVTAKFPDISVLLTSGFTNHAITPVANFLDNKGLPYPLLAKPYRFNDLAKFLSDALARKHLSV
jgi:PAS domain S-box-containing protein